MATTIALDISAADDRKNFTWNGATNTIESQAVVGEGAMACGNTASIETNGGYIRCVPTLSAGLMSWGLSLEGHGPGVSDGYLPLSGYATDIIDIGIEYTLNGAVPVYRIIDGQITNNVYVIIVILNQHAMCVNLQMLMMSLLYLVKEVIL